MKPGFYYFAHPYSSKTKEGLIANFELCCQRSAELLLKGYNVFSPIVHSHSIEMASPEMLTWTVDELWQFWIDIDMAILEYVEFTGVILAPGWRTSKGCMREYEWFISHTSKAGLFTSNGKPYDILQYNDLIGD